MKQKCNLRKLKVGDEVTTVTGGVGIVATLKQSTDFNEHYVIFVEDTLDTLRDGWFTTNTGTYLGTGEPFYSIKSFRTPIDLTKVVVGSRVTFTDGTKDEVISVYLDDSESTRLGFTDTSYDGWFYNETGVAICGIAHIKKIKPPKKSKELK